MTIFLYAALVFAFILLVWRYAHSWQNLVGWVAVLSVQYELLPDFRLALSDMFVPALTLALVFARKNRKTRSELRSSLTILIILFAFLFATLGNLMAFVNIGSISRWTWLNKDVGLLDLIVCYFAVIRFVDTQYKLGRLTSVFVLSGSVINVLALAGGVARYIFDVPNLMIYDKSSIRLCGLMVNPSAYGGFIFCIFLIQLALVLGNSTLIPLRRSLQYLNLGFLAVACVMTISRSAVLGLLAGVFALVFTFRLKAAIRLAAFTCTILVVAGGLLYFKGFLSSDVRGDFWAVMFSSSSVEDRLDMNQAALQLFKKSPANSITGIGVGTFLARSDELLDNPYIIHNDFLWLLVETGVIGLCLFLAIVTRALRNCSVLVRAHTREGPIAAGVACSIFGTLVWMMGTEGLWHRHVWFLFGLSEVCYRVYVRRRAFILEGNRVSAAIATQVASVRPQASAS